ncbi:MAG: RNA ligase [Myxococcota bacterium]
MRKLLITRGPQGAGKSTLLRELGLSGHVLSPDAIRRTFASPVMDPYGQITTPQEYDRRVWGMIRAVLAERMSRGELVAVDATHRARGDFKMYRELASQYRYTIGVMDFSSIPFALARQRNQSRPDYEVVPEAVLRRTYDACQRGQVPEDVHRVLWAEDGRHREQIQQWVKEPVLDGDAYRAVCVIGDLQGCHLPLKAFFNNHPFDDDVLYLFVGDLCDRGQENARVVRTMLRLSEKPNVRIHWGNHENYLDLWARGEDVPSDEFNRRTLPELTGAGITRAQVDTLCDRLVEFTVYTRGGLKVMVNHAGLANLPEHPERISLRQYAVGTGYYNDPVDDRFSRNAPDGWIQIHGHRNPDNLATQAAPRSYNLEGQVEHGGQLRILMHDKKGLTPLLYDNNRFYSLKERQQMGALRDDETRLMPPWLSEMPDVPQMPAAELAAMRSHALIREKPLDSRPWISSLNFTRDAFYKREWDALNTTARGLFINNQSGEIAARSYDKFFNLGERPETRPENLKVNLSFPVTVYRKDNGFLGILGYDQHQQDLMFCSKTSVDSDFAGWFQQIFDGFVPPGKKELLRRYLRDTQATMAFEVIDPDNDPHIIAYDQPRLVLLDVIRRHADFQRVSYKKLQAIGKFFHLEVKGRAMTFERWDNLWGWLTQARAPDYRFSGEYVEGFVLEDRDGFQFKLKADYYNHWKAMRGLKDRILSIRTSGKPLGRDVRAPRVRAFYDWANAAPDEVLAQDIIAVRKLFLEGAALPERAPQQPQEPRMTPAARGFQRALDNITQLAHIKPKTADNLLRDALKDVDKMMILRDHEGRDRILLSATPGPLQMDAAEAVNMDLDEPDPQETGA